MALLEYDYRKHIQRFITTILHNIMWKAQFAFECSLYYMWYYKII